MTPKPKVYILGAGISGLSLAYFLIKRNFEVHIFEQDIHVGGLLGTIRNSLGFVETGANAFMATQQLEDISKDIGVELVEKKTSAKKRYVFRDGKTTRFPVGFFAGLRILQFIFKFTFFKQSIRPKEQEGLQDWGRRVLGDENTEYLLVPAMQGVYASSSPELSAGLILKALFSKSYPKGVMKGSVAPIDGMGVWVSKMKDFLVEQGCVVELSRTLSTQPKDGPVVLACDLVSTQKVVKAWGLHNFKEVLDLKSLSLTSVTVLFHQSQYVKQGFGCLFPKREGFNALGVLWNHNIFDKRSKEGLSETWIFNDEKEKVSRLSDDEIELLVNEDRFKITGFKEKADKIVISRWPKKIPFYSKQLEKTQPSFMRPKNNIFLHGNYTNSLGLSKILQSSSEIAVRIKEEGVWPG